MNECRPSRGGAAQNDGIWGFVVGVLKQVVILSDWSPRSGRREPKDLHSQRSPTTNPGHPIHAAVLSWLEWETMTSTHPNLDDPYLRSE